MGIYEGSYERRPAEEISGGGNAAAALEAALWAFSRSSSFREGALLAANLGRDCDVVGADLRATRRGTPGRERDSRNLA